jgi:endonuclease/exonuclease/phosphatase family metal-dependent hydrolase
VAIRDRLARVPPFTLATWNLENLFLPGTEGGPPDQATYEAKLDTLATTIAALAPDVLAVQEVGQPEALEDLRARLGTAWRAVLDPDADDRGIAVGYLTRHPIEATERIRAFPPGTDPVRLEDDGTTTNQMGRGALHIRVTLDGEPVDLITAHLKSKLLRFANDRFSPRNEGERARYAGYALALRTAEAITLRHHATQLLDGEGATRALVLLGDFNDEPLAATTQILLGPPGSELGTRGFGAPDKGDGMRLSNVAPALPPERAFSRVFDGRPELIDHILLSRRLVTHLQSADTGPAGDAALPSVTTDPTLRRAATGSDHAPVLARIDLAAPPRRQ